MYNSNNLSSSCGKSLTYISRILGTEYSEYIERSQKSGFTWVSLWEETGIAFNSLAWDSLCSKGDSPLSRNPTFLS